MKLENQKKANQLVRKIKKMKDQNAKLNSEYVVIIILDKNGVEVIREVASKKGMEPYAKEIRTFINNLSVKITDETQELTKELEKL